MPTPAETAYRAALIEARDRGYSLSRAALRAVDVAFRDALARLTRDAAIGTVTAERAERLRREIIAVLAEIERELARTTGQASNVIVRDLVDIHRDATVSIGQRYAAGLDTGAISARFDTVATRALQALAARGDVAATFRTLIRRHMVEAAPALDRVLRAGVAQGMSTRRLTEDVAAVLNGGERPASLRTAGLTDADLSGLRSLRYDATRIARSETLNALREGGRQAAVASPVIMAQQWQLSGRHAPSGCACEVLAKANWHGMGPGFFPPEAWPIAPHPFCSCYAGSVKLRPPSQWAQAKPAGPPRRLTPARAPKPTGYGQWTDARKRMLSGQLAHALAG